MGNSRGEPLIGGDEDQVAVTIEPATGDHLLGLMLAAYGLTAREREISREVMAGHSTTDIAARLFISHKTVASHLAHIFDKLDVHSRVEAAGRAHQFGLVEGWS